MGSPTLQQSHLLLRLEYTLGFPEQVCKRLHVLCGDAGQFRYSSNTWKDDCKPQKKWPDMLAIKDHSLPSEHLSFGMCGICFKALGYRFAACNGVIFNITYPKPSVYSLNQL